jgi:hypothetical protein
MYLYSLYLSASSHLLHAVHELRDKPGSRKEEGGSGALEQGMAISSANLASSDGLAVVAVFHW